MQHRIITLVLLSACTIVSHSVNAQLLKKLQRKLEDKVEKTVDNAMNGTEKKNGGGTTGAADLPYVEEVFSFIPGTKIYYADSLTHETAGAMPKYWKTHSSGAVVTIPGVAGKWLKMESEASYRLDTLLAMPATFTLEFDILTRSDQASDVRGLHFGFSRDNSARSYIYGVSSDNTASTTALDFYYNTVRNTSNDTKTDNSLEYPLNNFGNAVIHVAMAIDSTHMRVYLNRSKVLDARMFNPQTVKYFYISTDRMRNNAQVFISNLKIAEN